MAGEDIVERVKADLQFLNRGGAGSVTEGYEDDCLSQMLRGSQSSSRA